MNISLDELDRVSDSETLYRIKDIKASSLMTKEEKKALGEFDDSFAKESILSLINEFNKKEIKAEFSSLPESAPFKTKEIFYNGIPFRYTIGASFFEKCIYHMIELCFIPL